MNIQNRVKTLEKKKGIYTGMNDNLNCMNTDFSELVRHNRDGKTDMVIEKAVNMLMHIANIFEMNGVNGDKEFLKYYRRQMLLKLNMVGSNNV